MKKLSEEQKDLLEEMLLLTFDKVSGTRRDEEKKCSKIIDLAETLQLSESFIDTMKEDFHTEFMKEWDEVNGVEDRRR